MSLTREMIDEAMRLVPGIEVFRTITSPHDTLIGHLGEMAFAEIYPGGRRHDEIGALQEGVHPMTGEDLTKEDVFQNAQIREAISAGLKALKKEHQKAKKLRDQPRKAGESWSEEEDVELGEAFDNGEGIDVCPLHRGGSVVP